MPRNSTCFVPLALAATFLSFAPAGAQAASSLATNNVTITLDPSKAKATAIPDDFAGLSFEMDDDHQNDTTSLFDGVADPLSTVIQTLGVRSIRVGGGSGEKLPVYPTKLDMYHMNDFCQLINANLIWLVPVKSLSSVSQLDSYAALATAMYKDHAAKGMTFREIFEVGNEANLKLPDSPSITEAQYNTWFSDYLSDLRSGASTDVQLSGPDATSTSTWPSNLAKDARYTKGGAYHGNIGYIAGHNYPGGNAALQSNATAAITTLLSPEQVKSWQTFYNGFPHTAIMNYLVPRISETNTFYNGGYAGASNAFASSLWALDYLSYYSTKTNLGGLNFHNVGGFGKYNAIVPYGPSSTYTVQGVGYGLLAYKQLGGGNAIPTTVSNPSNLNLTAYSVLHTSGSERMAILNKSFGASAANAAITIVPGMTHSQADVMFLTAPGDDPAALTGITLGGQSVQGNGTWSGAFTLHLTAVNGKFTFTLPATQAAIVYLHS